MYRAILIPTDGSYWSEQALKEGLSVAKALSASVILLHVVEDPIQEVHYAPQAYRHKLEVQDAAKDAGIQILKNAHLQAETKGITSFMKLEENSSPEDAILKAQVDADLIVIGTHGRRGFNRFVFGSVAEAVIRRANTPCLIVRSER